MLVNRICQRILEVGKRICCEFGIRKNGFSKEFYKSVVSKHSPWVYIAYISEVFYHQDEKLYLSGHQNRLEAICMVDILNNLGYNVYVQQYDSNLKLPHLKNVKMVFGHEPNLIKAAKKYPQAKVVQYATGAYVEHANSQIIKMTDYVNKKYHSHLPYRRLVKTSDKEFSIHKGYEISDVILQIGSKFTIATMPSIYRDKIRIIHQSVTVTNDISIIDAKENEFLFLASWGNMLKGVPLLLEYFCNHQNVTLHMVGPMEEDYLSLINDEITPNIHLHGFLNVNSEEFVDIVKKCNFIVYPSGTEGLPGSVLCAMRYGLIPIVTPWAAFDEIDEYGYLMDYNWNVESVEKGINWALSLSSEERLQRKKRCKCYVLEYYNLKRFTDEYRALCVNFLKH